MTDNKKNETNLKKIALLEKKIGYKFLNMDILKNALTHSSFANESNNNNKKSLSSNERLEFLGDSILNMTISEYLFKNYPQLPEGELTKIRSIVVCAVTLSKCSRNLDVGEFLVLGKGEVVSGGKNRDSILADAFEAIIGAIFIDSGLDYAKEFILKNLNTIISESVTGEILMDYKTQLQELVQKNADKVDYDIIDEQGPDHDKIFQAQVRVGERLLGKGSGKTKKEAEQRAAQKTYKILQEEQM